MFKLVLIFCALYVFVDGETYQDSIATRSTEVDGILLCGNQPYPNAYVRLYRSSSEDLNDVIASGKTDEKGKFQLKGDTSRFQGEASAIDPYLRIYHKCDEAPSKSGFRKVEIRYPRDFVTLGKVPRRAHHIGKINLELIFPKEAREKNTEGFN